MHLATNQNKFLLVKLMLSLHNVKRFFKIRAEPIYQVFRKHPITRGMASYLVIWPVGSVLQQIWSDYEKIDFWKVARFGLYGSLITAPSLYGWIRLSTAMWPNTNLRIAAAKVRYRKLQTVSSLWIAFAHFQAIVEQFSYTPIAMSIFFYSMTWLESFSAAEVSFQTELCDRRFFIYSGLIAGGSRSESEINSNLLYRCDDLAVDRGEIMTFIRST